MRALVLAQDGPLPRVAAKAPVHLRGKFDDVGYGTVPPPFCQPEL